MSFDLRIRFSGLMIWVPEPGHSMHVLLPSTHGHVHGGGAATNGGGVHGHEYDRRAGVGRDAAVLASSRFSTREAGFDRVTFRESETRTSRAAAAAVETHFTRIIYDAAYEKPGQTQLSRTYVMVDLEDRVLDLTGLSTSDSVNLALPDELPSLDNVAHPVDPALVSQMPDHRVAARVTMDAGALTQYDLGAALHLESADKAQRMTSGTEWTIRGIASRMPVSMGGVEYLPGLVLRGPEHAQENSLPNLFPISNTIHLSIFHTISSEFPPKGRLFQPSNERDAHFSAYYGVCPPVHGVRIPERADDLPLVVRGDEVKFNEKTVPSAICVQAQARLG